MHLDVIMDGAGDEAIIFDQLNSAIIGVDHNCNLVYSHSKMIDCFMSQGMTLDEAIEWIDYNVLCINGGEGFTVIMQEREEI